MATAMMDPSDASDFLYGDREAFIPREPIRRMAWAVENIVNEHGHHYDRTAFPHIGAPGGPMDSGDDEDCRTIAMQWATRLGKTFFGQCELLYTAAVDPSPMLIVSSVESLGIGVARRIYKMIHKSDDLNEMLAQRPQRQRQALIEFFNCDLAVGWSGSVSTLADRDVKVGHANEIDKWEHASTAKEADPIKLFSDRFKNHWGTRKVIYESTPTIKGHSRIERLLESGTNCRYHVPCPHCKRYQVLEFGDGKGNFGVRWDKVADPQKKIESARKTSKYLCIHCGQLIGNENREWMMNHGVWVPLGATVDDAAAFEATDGEFIPEWTGWGDASWIASGAPESNENASYQLSSLYALTLTWGDFASEFVECDNREELIHNWKNQWDGLTYELRRLWSKWESVADRLKGKHMSGVLPDDVAFTTLGIDVQGDVFVWVVVGWAWVEETVLDPDGVTTYVNEYERAYIVKYGKSAEWSTIIGIMEEKIPGVKLGGLAPILAGIDSGNDTDDIYAKCRNYKPAGKPRNLLRPTKGSESQEQTWVRSNIASSDNKDRRKQMAESGMHLYLFAKPHYQTWLQARLDNGKAGERYSISIPENAAADASLMEELLNNAKAPNKNGKLVWGKIKEGSPDDYRDALIIARVIRDIQEDGDDRMLKRLLAQRKRGPAPLQPLQLPGIPQGDQPFLSTDR